MKRYTAYKDSGIEWIGQLPSHWERSKVSWCFSSIGSGTTPKSDNAEYYDNGSIDWVITGDLNDGILKTTSKKITQKALDDCSSLKLFPKGTLLVAMYGATIGKVAIMDFDGYTNQACCAITNSQKITIRLTYYWFLANKQNIINMSYGGGQPNINQDIIKALKIAVPPKDEQQAIADFLDKKTALIDGLIEKKKRQIELLKEQRQAVINQSVTKGLNPNAEMKDSGIEWLGEIPKHWEVKPIKYCVITNQESLSETTDQNYSFRYVDIGNVNQGGIVNPPEEMTFAKSPSRARRIVKKGDTIVSTVRTYLKAIAFIDAEENHLIVSTGFAVLTPQMELKPKYLYFLMSCEKIIDTIMVLSVGVSYPAINSSDLNSIPLWFPPSLDEQSKIIQHIENEKNKINNSINKAEKQIELLQEYRTALISEAVTGKIDVRKDN